MLTSPTPSFARRTAQSFAHPLALITLFLLGNLIISFPKGTGQTSSLWGLLAAGILGAAGALFCRRFSDLRTVRPTTAEKVLCVGLLLLCLLTYWDCCSDYLHMVHTLRLPETPLCVAALFYLGLTVLFSSARPDMAAVFSLVSVLFVAGNALFMWMVSIKSFDLRLLMRFLTFQPMDIVRQTLNFYTHSFGALLLPVLYLCHTGTALKRRPLWGVCLAFGILLLCLSQIILVLGSGILERMDYPYTSATGAITTNHSFTRTDGITFYVYFVASLIKASLCSAVAVRSSRRCFHLSPWWTRVGFSVLTWLLLLVLQTHRVTEYAVFSWTLLALEIILLGGYALCFRKRAGHSAARQTARQPKGCRALRS